jgi:hypothetical protein
MRLVADRSDDHIDALLRSLPAAPERWVSLMQELPLLETALERLDGSGSPGADDLPALRAALTAVGLEPNDERLGLLERLRDRRRTQAEPPQDPGE